MKRAIIFLFLFTLAAQAEMLKQSTARNRSILMIDSTDHVSGKTGLTLAITASKDGGSLTSITPTVTELANGWYSLALTTTHTNTLGDFVLHITATGADPTDIDDQVVALLPGDSVTVGTNNDKSGYALSSTQSFDNSGQTTNLPTDVKKINAVATTSVTAVNANIGQTQPINFTGTGASALVKTDVTDFGGAAGTFASGIPTTTFNNSSIATVTTVTNQLTAAQIATGVWQDTTSGDFTTALSIGKSVMNGVSLGTGLTINGYTGNTPQTGDNYARIGVAGAGLTALGDARIAHLDADVSSRMATYTQPNGFLAATFPSGTIANTTNITAGTITTATNLTTNNDKTGYSLTVTPPTSAQIATTIFTDLLSTSDFSTGSSFGKLVKDDLDAAITTRLATSGYTAPDNADAAAAATNTTNLPAMLENVSGYRFTTHALMQGSGGSIDYSAAADAIWNFDLSAVSPSGQKTENYLKRIK